MVRQMRAENKATAIIVTSPQHTRRIRALWNRLAGAQPQMVARAAWQDNFDAKHWWGNTRDTFAVVREIMGLLNVWLGFPVQPHAS